MRMQRSLDVNLLPTLRPPFNQLQISSYCLPPRIVHLPCSLIAHPSVCSSPPRVNPHDMFEPEIVPQRRIDYFDRHGDELPALVADVGFGAACSDLIVIRQVYIKNQFFGQRAESGGFAERLAIARVGGVDGPNLETGGVES